MRILIAVVALAVGTVVYAVLPAAAVQQAGGKVAEGLAERIQDLNLTDAQEAKIAETRKECGPKVREAAKELATVVKEEMTKIMAVLTPEQKEKLATHKEERAEFRDQRLAERIAHLKELDLTDAELAKLMEIRKECHPKLVSAMKGLEGLLTDEQKSARAKALDAGMKRTQVIAVLKLTGEQKEKAEAVGKEVRSLIHDELAKMQDVLTEGQQAKLQEFKDERREHVRDRHAFAVAHAKDLNLTDAQKQQIAAIRQEYRPRVHEAGNRLRASIREEVDAIVNVIKR
jgi:Spy/CpxP family protein refolding chaperone